MALSLTESIAAASYVLCVQQRSSVLTEIGWLLYFLAVFAVLVYAFNIFVVPLRFNDKIADVLAGLIAGLALIFTRAYVTRRNK